MCFYLVMQDPFVLVLLLLYLNINNIQENAGKVKGEAPVHIYHCVAHHGAVCTA